MVIEADYWLAALGCDPSRRNPFASSILVIHPFGAEEQMAVHLIVYQEVAGSNPVCTAVAVA